MVLAAGQGSRLGELSTGRPKCDTPIAGRTLLDWQRVAFDLLGLHQRTLVVRAGGPAPAPTGSEQLFEVNGAGGPMDSLFALPAEPARSRLLVSYGDIVFRPSLVSALLAAPGDIVVLADRSWHALWSLRFSDVLSDAETFRSGDGRLVEIGARAASIGAIEAQFIGLVMLSHSGFERLRQLHRFGDDFTRLLARVLEAGQRIDVALVDGGWCEVDSPEDLRCYDAQLASTADWLHDWRTCGDHAVAAGCECRAR